MTIFSTIIEKYFVFLRPECNYTKYEKKYFVYDIVFYDAFGIGIMLSKS